MPFLDFASPAEVDLRMNQVRQSTIDSVKAMRLLLKNEPDGLQALRIMKFEALAFDPLESSKLNLLEQLNLGFNHLVVLEAARWLLSRHGSAGPLRVNVGALRGLDIESVEPGRIAAKAYAATHPQSDGRLTRSLGHLGRVAPTVTHRYVFMACPRLPEGRQQELERGDGIEIWSFLVPHLMGERRAAT